MAGVLAVVAVAVLLAAFVGVQHRDLSRALRSPVGQRFGDPPPAPVPAVPIDIDSRFDLVPQRRITLPLLGGGALLVAAVGLGLAGLEPLAAFVAVVGLLEVGAAWTALRSNRRALDFLEERLFDPGGSGSGGSGAPP